MGSNDLHLNVVIFCIKNTFMDHVNTDIYTLNVNFESLFACADLVNLWLKVVIYF